VSEWSDMSTKWTVLSVNQQYKNTSKRVGLVQCWHHHLIVM